MLRVLTVGSVPRQGSTIKTRRLFTGKPALYRISFLSLTDFKKTEPIIKWRKGKNRPGLPNCAFRGPKGRRSCAV